MVTYIACGNANYQIVGMSSVEYPDLPSFEQTDGIFLNAKVLREMIRQTVYAVSENTAMPIYTGSLFEIENGIFKMLMRDMGFYDHTVGLYFESKDGLNWQNPQIGWFGAEHYIKQPPAPKHLKRYGRFERPQVLMKNGKPAYLFTASQGGKAETSSGFVFKIKPE